MGSNSFKRCLTKLPASSVAMGTLNRSNLTICAQLSLGPVLQCEGARQESDLGLAFREPSLVGGMEGADG